MNSTENRTLRKDKYTALKRLLSYSKKYTRDYWLGALFSVLNKLFDIMPEILIGIAIDIVVNKEASFVAKLGVSDPLEQIFVIAGLTLFIWIFESLFEFLLNLRWKGLAQKIQHELRVATYSHVQSLDLKQFEGRSTGGLVAILNDDINQLERFLNEGANSLIQVFTTILLIGAVFFFISPLLTLVSFIPIPVILVGAFYFQRKAEPLYASVRAKVADLTSRLTTNLTGLATIKSFVTEDLESQNVAALSAEYGQANQRAIKVSAAFIPLIRMAILSGFIVTFVLGAHLTLQGKLNIGLYGVLVFLTQRLLWPVTGLAATLDLFERAMASTHRVLDLLDVPIQIKDTPQARPLLSLKPSFKISNLHFSYEEPFETLKNINLEIPFGKTVALVGPTGSGKSTLAKLILRFYNYQGGQIWVDGQAIEELQIKSLREKIGLVSQEPFLFNGSLRENITYGSQGVSEDFMIEAAKKARIHDFIMTLPAHYDAIVGERGQKLSGGQKQRLALARALIKNPPLLILDEATSAVDNETESLIQNSILSMKHSCSMLLIAHRLSTITHADQIHVLDQGRIVESGSHDELLAKNGLYARLWELQIRGS